MFKSKMASRMGVSINLQQFWKNLQALTNYLDCIDGEKFKRNMALFMKQRLYSLHVEECGID
jgi:hypothetical protein